MKNLNKSLLNVLKDKAVQRKITRLYCKLHASSFEKSNFKGHKWSILVDPTGKVEHIYSDGDMEAIWEYSADSIVVAQIVDEAEVQPEDLGEIKYAPQYEEFIECLIDDFDDFEKVDPNSLDYLEKKTKYIEENSTWAHYYEFDEQDYEALEIEAWKKYSRACATDKIEYAIQQTINSLEKLIATA